MQGKIDFILLCDMIIEDSTSKRFSMINALDHVLVDSVPALQLNLGVATRLTAPPPKKGLWYFSLRIVSPDEQVLVSTSTASEWVRSPYWWSVSIKPFAFTSFGDHRVEIFVEETPEALEQAKPDRVLILPVVQATPAA